METNSNITRGHVWVTETKMRNGAQKKREAKNFTRRKILWREKHFILDSNWFSVDCCYVYVSVPIVTTHS